MSLVWWLRCLLARSRPLTATRAIPPPARSRSDARPAANLSPETDAPTRELKSIRDIPGHGLLWTFYWHFLKGYSSKSHELQIMQKKKFGPIWRSRFGPLSVINVASVDMIESILRQEGKYPIRSYMPHWREYRELRGKTYGPLCEYGQKWHHIRSILNPKMLKPKEVATYSLVISEVVADLVKRIRWLREARGDGLMVYDISSEFYKFAFEAICKIVFETRLGCLKEEIPEETQKFIAAVFEIFTTTAIIPFFPKVLWTYVPYWKKFLDAWDYVFYITEKLVNKRMREIETNMKEGKEMSGEYLTYLLTNTNMTPKDIYGSLSEVLLAAVDTTSNTTSWIFYHLAREQSIQQQLYEEVNNVCPGDQIPVAKDFVHMPLLKAVVKETLRLSSTSATTPYARKTASSSSPRSSCRTAGFAARRERRSTTPLPPSRSDLVPAAAWGSDWQSWKCTV
ncbi:cytochrome P450 isoform X2 [Narcine bancroftii]|uniref:cytochrome P450 isoform X2 n=1 Tax=Narcine bancroftii TaxID=1343680 RepID=UPI0038317843